MPLQLFGHSRCEQSAPAYLRSTVKSSQVPYEPQWPTADGRAEAKGPRAAANRSRQHTAPRGHAAAYARTCGGITVMACLHDCFCRDQTVVRQEEAPLTGVDHLVALGAYATYHARMASPRGGQPPSLESSIRLGRECRAVHTWAIKRVVCMCVCVPCGGAS